MKQARKRERVKDRTQERDEVHRVKTGDVIVDYMLANNIPLTARHHEQLNSMGDVSRAAELEGESLIELEELVEDDLLCDTDHLYRN